MATLTEHLLKLTDHRERELLELTLAKALIDLLPVQRVVIARVFNEEGVSRWMEIATLDAKGGGKVVDPLRVNFSELEALEDARDRYRCIQSRALVEIAWAGADGPRITYLPLFDGNRSDEDGVLEVHSPASLTAEQVEAIGVLLRVFRNMFRLLAYSDRDGLTGLYNRKSLDDTFYSAVLEELDQNTDVLAQRGRDTRLPGRPERRHRVPPNYWLGTVNVDHFGLLGDRSGHLIAEEVLLLVARILSNTFRTYDRLYRLSSEQFAVLMHCPDEALVLAAFERLRANMEKFNFPQVGRVTASASFTKVNADDSPSSTLERAERGVDYAQRMGGNRVFSFSDLMSQGLLSAQTRTGPVDLF